jgi:uncharacterized protein YifN (PemK superfamily)
MDEYRWQWVGACESCDPPDYAAPPLPEGFTANVSGHMPAELTGKRVVVQLRSGDIDGVEPVSTVTPSGWAADGRQGCRWTLLGVEWDVVAWKLAK